MGPRARRLALALAALAAIGAGCEGVILEDGTVVDDGSGGGGGGGEPPTADAWQPAPPPLPLPDMAIAAAAGEIAGIASSVGFTRSIRVENATTGQAIAAIDAGTLLKPASNTKLFTTAASFELVGEDAGIELAAYRTGDLGADGRVAGDLVLVGGHDFTLSSRLYPSARTPLDRLAGQLRRAGVTSVAGTVVLSGEFVYEGNSVGALDVAGERLSVVEPARAALAAAGIAIGAVTTSAALEPPAGATLVVRHAPVTLASAASYINVPSHNEFADLLVRRLGYADSGSSSYAAGGAAMIEWLGAIGVPTAGVSLNDGSGLSSDNRVSADVVIALLAHMEASPLGTAWRRTLAIAGVRGTIATRMTGADTRGRVFAKTGTLRDTITLSGYLENGHDGQRYRFSVLFNAVSDQALARARADAIVAVVARNLRGSAPRPAAPRLDLVRGVGWDGFLEIGWQPVDGAAGYLVWLSRDGRVWSRDDARLVDGTHVVFDELPAAGATHVRITALGADGLESDPSQVLAGWASGEAAEILLVDGNERWRAGPMARNVLGEHHDFLVGLVESSPGRRVASASNAAVVEGAVSLADYPVVVWTLGEESMDQDAMSPDEQALLAEHVAGGGGLLVSAAELLYALDARAGAGDAAFAADVLRAGYVADDSETKEFEGRADGPFAAVPLASFDTPDGLSVEFPDVLAAGTGATVLVDYVGGTGGAAVVGYQDTGRVIVTGFPVESILSESVRAAFLDAAYGYLGLGLDG